LYRDVGEREEKSGAWSDAISSDFRLDVEGRILEANDAFLHMGDMTWDLATVACADDLTPAEWRERDERAACRAELDWDCQSYEKEYFRKMRPRSCADWRRAVRAKGSEGVRFRTRFDRA